MERNSGVTGATSSGGLGRGVFDVLAQLAVEEGLARADDVPEIDTEATEATTPSVAAAYLRVSSAAGQRRRSGSSSRYQLSA